MFIDADSHLLLRDFFDDFSYSPQFAEQYRQTPGGFTKGGFASHQKFLEEQGIHRQLINWAGLSTGMKYRLPVDLGVAIMQYYNDRMQKIISQDSRFDMTLWLALQSVEASLLEIERTKDWKFLGYHFSDCVPWGLLPEYDGLFARLAELKIPMYVHIGGLYDQPRDYDATDPVLCQLRQDWPDQRDPRDKWMSTLVTFITSGMLDRHPDLRIVFTERNINWARGLQTYMLEHDMPDPLPYFKRNFWFTTEPETPDFVAHAEFLGWDRLLFATDFPHYVTDAGGTNQFKDVETVQALGLSNEQLAALTWQNYVGLFNRL